MVSALQHVSDFANLFKAFIGSNYLSMSFGFSQAGVGVGLGILAVIALVTDHCCQLIVECKHLMIEGICEDVRDENKYRRQARLEESDEDIELNFATNLHNSVTLGDIAKYTYGRLGYCWVNFSLFMTQFGFCINYFIFIGNTLGECFPERNASLPLVNETLIDDNGTADFNSSQPLWYWQETAPDLRLLVASPLPIFLGFSLIRSIRSMGGVSVVANISICVGVVTVLSLLLHDFRLAPDLHYARLYTLPVYIGIVAVSYEGIGTIIPIEASMEGNRHNFRAFLRGSLFLVTMILGVIGVVGYMRYGRDTEQILVKNLPSRSWLITALDITLIIGVIFTFPLQIFPVIEMVEHFVFARKGYSGTEEEEASLIASHSVQSPDSQHGFLAAVPPSTPAWQRNCLRLLVVLCQLGLAIALRNYYAYFSSFIGAVGSIFLAFVLPCAAHMRLLWHQPGRRLTKLKDATICLLGCLASVTSLFVTVVSIISPHFFN